MKKTILLIAILLLSFPRSSEAVLVSAYTTADNVYWIWGYDGAGHWGGSSWYAVPDDSWPTAENIWDDVILGETKDLYFAVMDQGAPAGFLADIRTAFGVFSETGSSELLSDPTHWGIVAHSGWTAVPTFNPVTDLSSWVTPTAYGFSDVSDTPWYGYLRKPVDNVDTNAQWIWTARNFGANPNLNHSEMDTYAILHTRFTVVSESVIPEPSTILIFGFGLLGLIFKPSVRMI